MYMSRLSALKEYSFMKVLRENGFRVPEPVAQSRHTVVMELVDAFPLRQIQSVPDPAELYAELIGIVLRLARFGLIHGDFNEFNILIREDKVERPGSQKSEDPAQQARADKTTQEVQDLESPKESAASPSVTLTPVIIDFPQMVSIDHINAEMYFDRDINCIKRFFERRFNFVSDEQGPLFADAKRLAGGKNTKRLDIDVEASGFSKKMAKELEKYMQAIGVDGDGAYSENDRHSEDDSTVSEDFDGVVDGPSQYTSNPADADKDSPQGQDQDTARSPKSPFPV